jgi:hypothetical protein
MKGRRLLALSALALVFGCEDHPTPTGPTGPGAPATPSAVISDGGHVGGNPDFFFLPPLVWPFGDPTFRANFELGKFNNALAPSLKIDICVLTPEFGNALPKPESQCAGAPLKTFDFGSVKVVNLPLRERGWWWWMGLPPDGFYYVLWDTRQSNLVVGKFYRIKVFLGTSQLGYADVDPMSSLREWRFSLTGQVIQLINGVLLPIPFRIEKNGSPCLNNRLCTEQTVTNAGGLVTVTGNAGQPLAGALFPPGWLPTGPGLPDRVLVSISQVNTGPTNGDGTQTIPCHRNLPLEQFYSCFKFTTFPKLGPNSTNFPGHQFQLPVRTAVCYVRIYSEDPRSEWVQLWASDDGANFRKLPHDIDGGILSPDGGRDCANPPAPAPIRIIGDNPTGLRGLASAGWRKLKGGLGQLFAVQTAYGVDLGLGGTILDFSNISPAMTAQILNAGLSGEGLTQTASVQILGISHHDLPNAGVNGIPVTFTVDSTSGNFGFDVETRAAITQRIVYTAAFCGEGCEDGIASVNWTVLNTAGPHTMTANGPALGGPITFTIVVPPPPPPIP